MSLNGYQHMVLDDFVERVRAMRAERRAKLDSMKTADDARAYCQYVRRVVADAFIVPEETVPLDAVVANTVRCEGYHVENVRFCSRKNFWVTASLFVPGEATATHPVPAVLGLCGHGQSGRMCDTYEQFAQRLALNGFVCLLVDPIQQGERYQYSKLTNLGMSAGLCEAHNTMGKQLDLLGDTFGSWRVWDARCALDYLLSRPEVDPKHVGVAGNSGGGTLTEWTFANDDRLTMAAPNCHVTTFLGNLENELPTDAEQCPPGVLEAGLEMVDLLFAQAPKPVLLNGQYYDFFERRGMKEAFEDLKHLYRLLGAEDKIGFFQDMSTHGYSTPCQREMIRFFRKHSGMEPEPYVPEVTPIAAKELWVTSEGDVVKAGSTPIYELLQEQAKEFAAARDVPETTEEWQALLKELLRLPERSGVPHYRIPRAKMIGDRYFARCAVETERSIRAILKHRLVVNGYDSTLDVPKEVHLLLPDVSSEEEMLNNEWAQKLNDGGELFLLDPRGLGESLPEEGYGVFHQAYGMDYMLNSFSTMFGESYFGRRVFDILRTLDLLVAEGAEKVHVYGHGQGAVLAWFAAMLHDSIVSIDVQDDLESYESWLNGVSEWPVASAPRDVLLFFDMPDLRAAVAKKLAAH